MTKHAKPLPGNRYVSQSGQIMKVRALLYEGGGISKVMIDYLDGVMRLVKMADWRALAVEPYLPREEKKREASLEV